MTRYPEVIYVQVSSHLIIGLSMLMFPNINPIALQLGPLAVRWYSLAYLAGIVLGWWVLKRLNIKYPIANFSAKALDDVVMYATLGIVLGGRLGYCLVYNHDYYFAHPLEILHVWKGGMSFHGGMLGLASGIYLLCKKHGIAFFALMDRVALVAPIGLFFGRMANFINGELFGRIADVPWAMVFPHGGELPRHPSQLYQAGMEGLLLGVLLLLCFSRLHTKKGALSGLFLVGYGAARMVGECFREPDAQLGFLYAGATMGQLLSIPMVMFGFYLLQRRPNTV
jgi:phosphatidylglycerol---prolipoprotein diacylglyceryl transferase